MKTLQIALGLTLSAFIFQACHSPDQKWDSKSSADSLNSMKDSTVDSTRSITKSLVMKVNKDDARFAVQAANGGMSEVALGKLAQQQASDQQVKDFGAMMVKDHSAANEKLMAIAKNKGITLPSTVSNDEQKLRDELSKKSGKDFDKAYVKAMVEDHQKDVKDFQSATQTLKDPDLKTFATGTLPILKMHLSAAEKAQNSIK